jgi:hypothetical protein
MYPDDVASIGEEVRAVADASSRHVTPDDADAPSLLYVHAPGGRAIVRVDVAARALYVSHIVPARPLSRIEPLLDDPDTPPESE